MPNEEEKYLITNGELFVEKADLFQGIVFTAKPDEASAFTLDEIYGMRDASNSDWLKGFCLLPNRRRKMVVSERDVLRAIDSNFDDMASVLVACGSESLIPLIRNYTDEIKKSVKILYSNDRVKEEK